MIDAQNIDAGCMTISPFQSRPAAPSATSARETFWNDGQQTKTLGIQGKQKRYPTRSVNYMFGLNFSMFLYVLYIYNCLICLLISKVEGGLKYKAHNWRQVRPGSLLWTSYIPSCQNPPLGEQSTFSFWVMFLSCNLFKWKEFKD